MIDIAFLDGRVVKTAAGTKVSDLTHHFGKLDGELAAVRANNKILPLSASINVNTNLSPVLLESTEGSSIYRHTLSFLLCVASKKTFPDKVLRVGHSLGSCYYFSYSGGKKAAESSLEALQTELDSLIKKDLPIVFKHLSYSDAVKYFKTVKQKSTTLLLEQSGESEIAVNECSGFYDLYVLPLLNRTGLAKLYKLFAYEDGFLLQFPSYEKTGKYELTDFVDSPKIFSVFTEHKGWGRIVDLHSVGQLNRLVAKRNAAEFINIAEAFADKKLANIADRIHKKKNIVRLILIAGPSSSGKTTTAKKLEIQLKMLGIEPIAVSLDDYYLPPDKIPFDENGEKDFECLEALDVPFLNEQLVSLFNGNEITLPVFDFKTSKRKHGKTIKLGNRNILLLEGIHGLNDKLTPLVENEHKFKIYVSALTQLNLDDHNRISTTDNRLLRRLVRDYQFRGMGAENTLKMWNSVQRGAEKYIFKFQNGADAVFNSALDYEISVLRLYAEPLLRSVSPESDVYSEASRLLFFLKNFSPIVPQSVPPLSVLREFIGESKFKY